jgi:glycine C-acetyltransferase
MELNRVSSATSQNIASAMETEPNHFSLGDFLVGDSRDPLQPPAAFTKWLHAINLAVELYEPVLLGPAEARTTLLYRGKSHPVINFSSYNYLGLANHPEVIAAAHEALATHGLGACGSPVLSGMSDLHRQL